jgi:hypothetical protein
VSARGRREDGFALVLALLAILLLTVLGLALATTTSMEMQIAANYRWEQQALYNAEAGAEVAKSLLRTVDWSTVLPAARAGSWPLPAAGSPLSPPTAPRPMRNDAYGYPRRDFENGNCDLRGNGVGYGVVLDDGSADAPYQGKSTIFGRTLTGAFTVWVRRRVGTGGDTLYEDDPSNDSIVLTVEGVAPYGGARLANLEVNRARRVLEYTIGRAPREPPPVCGSRAGQTGGGPGGSGYAGCEPITGGRPVIDGLGSAATGTGASLGGP